MTDGPIRYKDILQKINADWLFRDPGRDLKRDTLWARLTPISNRIDARSQPVSTLISAEAGWLLNYTEDWPRANAIIDALEASLEESPQELEQCPDGSWGPGCTEWYRKLEPTYMELMTDKYIEGPRIDPPPGPLTFIANLKDWNVVRAYLDGLRTSDISRTGRNNRDEFGAVMTALSLLIYNPDLKKVLKKYPELKFELSEDWKLNYQKYLKDLQNKFTGCWGPSYRFHGHAEVMEAQDLTFTFHNVHYWSEAGYRIPRLEEMAETILDDDVERDRFPYGWQTSKTSKTDPYWLRFNDHNNYDVLIPLKAAWSQMADDLQAYATPKLQMLLDWCLQESAPRLLNGDSTLPHDSGYNPPTATAFYYAVRFLDDAGYWDEAKRFWPMKIKPRTKPLDLACALLKKFLKDVDDHSREAKNVIDILKGYCPEAAKTRRRAPPKPRRRVKG